MRSMLKTAAMTETIFSSASVVARCKKNQGKKNHLYVHLISICTNVNCITVICVINCCVQRIAKDSLTRFYREHDGIGVTAVSKRSYPDIVPHVWLERPVAVHPSVHIQREFLAIRVHADLKLDDVRTAAVVIDDMVS